MSKLILARDPETTVEKFLVFYIELFGSITSLDRWAHDQGLDPDGVRRCAHKAARRGLVRLDRLAHVSGKPYRVSALEEETP
jgi:hypothetical protein